MGQLVYYKCLNCNYKISLFGRGRIVEYAPFHCIDCNNIIDLKVCIKPDLPDIINLLIQTRSWRNTDYALFDKLEDENGNIIKLRRLALQKLIDINEHDRSQDLFEIISIDKIERLKHLVLTDYDLFIRDFNSILAPEGIKGKLYDFFLEYREAMVSYETEVSQMKKECYECSSTNIVEWDENIATCPKCNYSMIRSMGSFLWD